MKNKIHTRIKLTSLCLVLLLVGVGYSSNDKKAEPVTKVEEEYTVDKDETVQNVQENNEVETEDTEKTETEQTNTEIEDDKTLENEQDNNKIEDTKTETTDKDDSSKNENTVNKEETKKPEPVVTFKDTNETVYSTASLNLRKGPGVGYNRVGALYYGQSVKRIGVGDNGWSKLEYNGNTVYANSSYLSTTKPVVNTPSLESSSSSVPNEPGKSKALNVKCILQNPELPTGCEVTSLAIALNYIRVPADKLDLADNHLPKLAYGEGDFEDAFIGNPRSSHGFGCFVGALVKTVNSYDSSLKTTDLSGTSFKNLFKTIDNDEAVIVWATMGLVAPKEITVWQIDGKDIKFKQKEHCLVLTGYDTGKNIVYVADPLKGNVSYDMDLFELRYNQMGMRAMTVSK